MDSFSGEQASRPVTDQDLVTMTNRSASLEALVRQREEDQDASAPSAGAYDWRGHEESRQIDDPVAAHERVVALAPGVTYTPFPV